MSKRQEDNPYKFSLLITCVPIAWKYSLTIGLFSVPTPRLLNALIVFKCPSKVSELNGKMSPLRSKECGRINKVVVGRGSLYCDTFRTSERYTDIVSFIDVVLYIFLATLQKNVRENWSEMDPSEQLGKVCL